MPGCGSGAVVLPSWLLFAAHPTPLSGRNPTYPRCADFPNHLSTEVGRQPYTVYGLLTTAQSASPVAVEAVAASLIAFIIAYFLLFGAGTFYIIRLMHKPPHLAESDLDPGEPIRASGLMPAPALEAKGRLHDGNLQPAE